MISWSWLLLYKVIFWILWIEKNRCCIQQNTVASREVISNSMIIYNRNIWFKMQQEDRVFKAYIVIILETYKLVQRVY